MKSDILTFLFMSKILQATSRGQVTLPKEWRDQYSTHYYTAESKGDALFIRPLITDDLKQSKYKREKNIKSLLKKVKKGYSGIKGL